ncbi:MAG: hypothetical protein BWY46_01616 [Firmicutes bacterium ADurb.Bin300]|nr:MAG: hypothetical protein BWY46_01616 [Firmicutes bacterium ADurb.Bin300]
MQNFKKITIDDRDILSQYLGSAKHYSCDYCLGNIILWADMFNTHYTVETDMLFIEFTYDNKNYFAFPMGKGDLKTAFEWLFSYCEQNGKEFKMNIIEPHMFEKVEKMFPGKFEISYKRNNADYVYNTQELKELSGRKYHKKKNHINKFLKHYKNWSYERISNENTEECIEMVEEWCARNNCLDEKQKSQEVLVVTKGLKHVGELNLLGGLIRVNEKIAAMTLGEKCSDDMFVIHFEKAFSDVLGAYPMINQQFIIHELSGYKYINREEDLGIEGLRKAKESYYPAFMVEKGILKRK